MKKYPRRKMNFAEFCLLWIGLPVIFLAMCACVIGIIVSLH